MSCQFYGCLKDICEHDKAMNDPRAMRFCEEHSVELNSYLFGEDVRRIRDFYDRASGIQKEGVVP
jgi:hypothetical protein